MLLSVVGVGMQQCIIRNQNEMQKLCKVKNGCANMQLTINSFRSLFPDKIFTCHFTDIYLTFSEIPDILLTAVRILDISRFSIQVVTLY